MSSEPETRIEITDGRNSEREELIYSVQPVCENKLLSLVLVVILLLISFGVYLFSHGDPLITFVSLLLLFGGLSPYFLVTRYELSTRGITQKRGSLKIEKKWQEFRSYHIGKKIIQLSPFDYPTRLESFRSMIVLLTKENRDGVIDFVQAHIKVDQTVDEMADVDEIAESE